ncbi:MAG: ATP-binding cassette domain-containing protein, partial [Chloroflexi bacterium]
MYASKVWRLWTPIREYPVDKPETTPNIPLVVTMKGIVKRFPGVLANDHVDFELRHGEIHALLGENGAGKSTLMNILAGLYSADAGTMTVNGKQVDFHSPKDAIKAGIGMIHQHFMLVPSQTVTENILLGMDEPRFRMNLNEYDRKIAELGERFGMKVDPKAKIAKFLRGAWFRDEAGIRGAGSRAPRGGYVLSSDSISLDEYAFAKEVTDEDRRAATASGAPPVQP